MMSNIRKTIVLLPLKIQYILIFVENIYRLCRFNWKLLFDNLKKDRIVIHSMGKVGSSTIDASLKPYKFNMPIFKTHYLNPLTVSKLWNEKFSIYRRRIRDHYLENKYLSEKINKKGLDKNNWYIITLVREPIITNISRFFQSIEDFIPNFYYKYAHDLIDNDKIIDAFFNDFPYHNWNLEWFDKEVKSVFNIDVYQSNFNMEKGYKIFHKKNIHLLLLKLDKLNECAQEAFDKFLDIKNFNVINTNISKNKLYYFAYQNFLKSIIFSQEYIDYMYSNKYTLHFYEEAEVEQFKIRWLKK